MRSALSWLVAVGVLVRLGASLECCGEGASFWDDLDDPARRDSQVRMLYVLRGGGVPTRDKRKWDGLHTRHLLESTHINTHKHTQTHSAARHVIGHTRTAERSHLQSGIGANGATISSQRLYRLPQPRPHLMALLL